MSRDNFDDEITTLYQQRKQQVVAPPISFTSQAEENTANKVEINRSKHTKNNSSVRLLTLLIVGSMASFGIMAIISHFSAPTKKTQQTSKLKHTISLVELAPNLPEEVDVLPAIPLPPKPELVSPISTPILKPATNTNQTLIIPNLSSIGPVTVISLPTLTEPELVIEPIYKVLPKYTYNMSKSPQYGEIQLSYQIDATGKTKDINIVSSNIDRDLQRSAKKALSQWQYNPDNVIENKSHQVVFKFSPPSE